ncbi:MAG: hypothetical protein CSB47_01895 [Proteobacteria bacterium]|nr:MAG: hypothetical protein CSB47_01895 [Pseudomonadota bacterium]
MTDNNTSQREANNPALFNTWRHFNLSIKAQPEDYKQHSQRILFALQSGLNKFLSGALQDLFIASGENAHSLRNRMYKLVLPLLDQNDREYFHEWLAHGSDKTLPCYRFPGAVLTSTTCMGSEGEPDPYLPRQTGSLLEKSRHAITYGRIETAQAQLEDAFTRSTTKAETSLVEEMLSLYAATRQKDKLIRFADDLKQQKYILSSHWKQVLESTKEW